MKQTKLAQTKKLSKYLSTTNKINDFSKILIS